MDNTVDMLFSLIEITIFFSGKSELIVNSSIPIEGVRPLLVDDLDVDKEGNIYWSDASSVSPLSNSVIDLLAGPSGR